MATLNDLMNGKQPGQVKVCKKDWNTKTWFKPYFTTVKATENRQWVGALDNEGYACFFADSDGWQLWQEPVEEVEVFEWMYKAKDNTKWVLYDWLLTEEQAKKYFDENEKYRKTGRSWRLPK